MLKKNKPFLIAEIGVNHDGKFNKAIKLINEAKNSGADAVKFQTYITEKLSTKKASKTNYQIKFAGKKDEKSFLLLTISEARQSLITWLLGKPPASNTVHDRGWQPNSNILFPLKVALTHISVVVGIVLA